jgi:primosomal protein N' (replication factor Y)
MPIIRVALDVPVNTLFDYIAPSATTQHIGVRVQVPFGRKMVIGVIVEVTTDSSLVFLNFAVNTITILLER